MLYGAYLQDYNSYSYEISWKVTTWGKTGVSCNKMLVLFYLYLASVNLGCMSLKFGSLLSILYDQYREIGQKPWNYRNMKSDLLSLALPDDLVRKVACLFPFCTTRNFVNAGGRVDSFDSPVYEYY